LASGHGVIIAAPHYGNWELLNQWLAGRTPLAILYRAPESAIGGAFLQRVRADDDGRVTQVRAEGAAVRQLFKRLNEGGVVGILPDQQPKAGEGEFAPFFGVQALTMTLLPRLAARSGATVLFAYCERIGAGPGFRLRFEAAPPELSAVDPAIGVRALNAAVEGIARRDPAQYQWTYKRYTLRPPGSGEDNPYYDLERHG
jgi:KDO2-lipid IV(A) lauroyltransferase